jgi:hypothetical protein
VVRIKGILLVLVAKGAKAQLDPAELDRLSEPAREILGSRILPASWYPLAVYEELLHAVWMKISGGRPSAALEMGRRSGLEVLKGASSPYVKRDDAAATALAMGRVWKQYFDAGAVEVTIDGSTARLTLRRQGPLSKCASFAIVGFAMAGVELSGAANVIGRLESRPWEDAGDLVYTLSWTSDGHPHALTR